MVLTTIQVSDSPRNEFPVWSSSRSFHGPFKHVRRMERKVKTKSQSRCFPGDTVKEFCQETSLHGLKYVGLQKYHVIARIIWTVAFLMALFLAVYFIHLTYNKWKRTPVIISTTSEPIDISDIPFPAITFSTPFRLSQKLKNLFLDDRNKYHKINKKLIDYFCKYGNLVTYQPENMTEAAAKKAFMRQILNCKNYRVSKSEDTKDYFMSRYVHKVYFEGDDCHCIFNAVKPEYLFRNWTDGFILNQYEHIDTVDWNIEKGYSTNDSIEAMPLRLTDFTAESMAITALPEADNCKLNYFFSFAIHNPTDIIPTQYYWNYRQLNKNYMIEIEPIIIFASEGLRSLEIERRKCYFQSEKYLRFFKTYSEHNCKLECVMNFTLKQCGCLRYSEIFFPGFVWCEENHIKCRNKNPQNYRECKCLPSCDELTYKVSTLEMPCVGFPCQLRISFSKQTYYGLYRSEFIGLSDFIASVGGLLGLFIGFSVLSVMEILYFIFLGLGRLCRLH